MKFFQYKLQGKGKIDNVNKVIGSARYKLHSTNFFKPVFIKEDKLYTLEEFKVIPNLEEVDIIFDKSMVLDIENNQDIYSKVVEYYINSSLREIKVFNKYKKYIVKNNDEIISNTILDRDLKDVLFGVIFPEGYEESSEKTIRAIFDFATSGKYQDKENKYIKNKLINIDFKPKECYKLGDITEYKKSALKLKNYHNVKFVIAIIPNINDDDVDNPYNAFKKAWADLKLPSQMISLKTAEIKENQISNPTIGSYIIRGNKAFVITTDIKENSGSPNPLKIEKAYGDMDMITILNQIYALTQIHVGSIKSLRFIQVMIKAIPQKNYLWLICQ